MGMMGIDQTTSHVNGRMNSSYLDVSSPNILGFHRIFLNHRDLTWECGYGIVWVNHNEGTT